MLGLGFLGLKDQEWNWALFVSVTGKIAVKTQP
jgi:hypothetical protein